MEPGDLQLLDAPPTVGEAKFGYYGLAAAGALGGLAMWVGAFWLHWALALVGAPLFIALVVGPFISARTQLRRLQHQRTLQRIS